MENAPAHTTLSRIRDIRHQLMGRALPDDDGLIRIVAASSQNWPELIALNAGEIALGDDGLVRLALWSASRCCATLLATRRATVLLPQGEGLWEIRCLVLANASLSTPRPLSGFLLRPVELIDGAGARSIGHPPEAGRPLTSETMLALFDAFPVGDDGEPAPPGPSRTS